MADATLNDVVDELKKIRKLIAGTYNEKQTAENNMKSVDVVE